MSALRLRALRPVGDSIILQSDAQETLLEALLHTDRYHIRWLNSGTEALALALLLAKKSNGVAKPEVILPAYGCPDLIAAALFANVRPVLVDIQRDSPNFDIEQLAATLNPTTIAIVAATFLGIRGDPTKLRSIIGDRPIALIEDSAQWLPRHAGQDFFGDHVALSFGRGKPLNLLGGGALLTLKAINKPVLPSLAIAEEHGGHRAHFIAKALAYNLLIHPLFYGLLEKIPQLKIGETRFHALGNIHPLNPTARKLLHANLRRFCTRDLDTQRRWTDLFIKLHEKSSSAVSLALHNRVPADYALLRYPILIADQALRDCIYAELRAQGLGASVMYPAALPELPGIPTDTYRVSSYANARQFAQRLLTLPTHRAVSSSSISRSAAIFEKLTLG
jgi:dTDP-4-amino-4,6-dideoxygalactose transaminase